MNGRWGLNRAKLRTVMLVTVMLLFHQNLRLSLSSDEEGLALQRFRERVKKGPLRALWSWNEESYRCFWFGVQCSYDPTVVRIVTQPKDKLRRMLLRMANFASPLSPITPPYFASSENPSSLPMSPTESSMLSPSSFPPSPSPSEYPSSSPVESPTSPFAPKASSLAEVPTQASPTAHVGKSIAVSTSSQNHVTSVNPTTVPDRATKNNINSRHQVALFAGIIGGFLFLLITSVGAFLFRRNKVVAVKPWATGLSGQLQKAFITGVPRLKRSELEIACEDFSNIVGHFSNGTVYKGTLSSGVEIAVTSFIIKSRKDWLKNSEEVFQKMIDILSSINHKNFVNLIGYCEDEEPFTRMMVFEYAPNGTFFEHLHVKEAEHLDWRTRLRVAMGTAYCLECMHMLNPPIVHGNLQSSSILLTEDYAAKISYLNFLNDINKTITKSTSMEPIRPLPMDPSINVYDFGVILYEMITGKMPNAIEDDFLTGNISAREMVDPTLDMFKEDELEELFSVIKSCILHDNDQRPTMSEVIAKLKLITAMGPDTVTPKLSPLWWAQLEIMSA